MSTNQHNNHQGGACAAETSITNNKLTIPADINSLSRLEAAEFYIKEHRWAIHPLNGPAEGADKEKGKKPKLKGYLSHSVSDIEPEFCRRHFNPTTTNNLGIVVAAPHVVVDLDSKPDMGASVRKWLADHPALATVPRERTTGGAHLHFICSDVPKEVRAQKSALVAKLNREVQAELFTSGNVVVSPSIHASGEQYQWEVFGDIPSVPWSFLASTFGFVTPESKKRGRPTKQPEWWHHYPQDLESLDLPGVMEELGMLGKLLDNHPKKYSVRCPWAHEHSNGSAGAHLGSDTAILCPPGKWPAFRCLHSHCSDRSLEHLVAFAESEKPGIIAKHCSRLRLWSPGVTDDLGREQIVLPGKGRPMGAFCRKLGKGLAKCKQVFRHASRVVEVELTSSNGIGGCSLALIQPAALITALETCVEVGTLTKDDAGGDEFVPQSMTEDIARVVLASRDFRDALPEIHRVLNVRIPMYDDDGVIVLPNLEYDERFKTYVQPNAPELIPMALTDAKALLADLLVGAENKGFWWKDNFAKDLALARILTPYARGLMDFKHGPLWVFNGNRPGIGKDTCAALAMVLFTGSAAMGAPLTKENDEEMRKRITTAVLHGVPFMHFANLKGEIKYWALEAATDNIGGWEDRQLGGNKRIDLPNEIDFSISANGAVWTPDLDRRLRTIHLHCSLEDLDNFEYRHPDILGLIRENRTLILSALHALVMHWDEQGRPEGPTPFASFPQWGSLVGGIMTCCGYSDPCRPQQRESDGVGGDETTAAMKELFRLAFEHFGGTPIRKEKFIGFAAESDAVCELFATCDLGTQGGRSSFMRGVMKFNHRRLGGILFDYTSASKNHGTLRFTRPDGDSPGAVGDDSEPRTSSQGGFEGLGGLSSSSSTESKNNSQHASEPWNYIPSLGTETNKSPKSPKSLPPRVCTNDEQLAGMASELMNANMLAVAAVYDQSDRNLDILKTRPKYLLLQAPDDRAWRIDLTGTMSKDTLEGALRLCLSGKVIVSHDTQPLLRWLLSTFGLMPAAVRCTRTAARLLTNGTNAEHDLDACLTRYLPPTDVEVRSQHGGFRLKSPAKAQPNQIKNDVGNLHALLAAMEIELEHNGLLATWMLENEALPAFVTMEVNGIHVDLPLLTELADQGNAQAKVLMAAVDANTSRIHSTFDPLGTATGRATSSKPPLQNVKRGNLREAFTTTEDRCLVIGDYANIDLRIVAVESQDERMLEVFRQNLDLHTITAAAVFSGKPAADVTPEERQVAKAMNLGIINGQNPREMVYSAKKNFDLELCAITHAIPYIEMFNKWFPRIPERIDECQRNADAGVREVCTRLGRRRLIPDDTPVNKRRGILLNTPIQGGTADGMKKAMALLHRRLPVGAMLVSNIHDELIVDCPKSMATEVERIVRETMIEGMNWAYPDVRIDVEITVGKTWADKGRKDYATPIEGNDDTSAADETAVTLILDETNHPSVQ